MVEIFVRRAVARAGPANTNWPPALTRPATDNAQNHFWLSWGFTDFNVNLIQVIRSKITVLRRISPTLYRSVSEAEGTLVSMGKKLFHSRLLPVSNDLWHLYWSPGIPTSLLLTPSLIGSLDNRAGGNATAKLIGWPRNNIPKFKRTEGRRKLVCVFWDRRWTGE